MSASLPTSPRVRSSAPLVRVPPARALKSPQAQKCYYEKAEADGLSTTIIVKIAKHGTTTYDEVLRRMRAPKLKANLDRGWPAVVEWQSLYFAGVRASPRSRTPASDLGGARARVPPRAPTRRPRLRARALRALTLCPPSLARARS
jgi:hypothetical protein